jgi:hypothetical protein
VGASFAAYGVWFIFEAARGARALVDAISIGFLPFLGPPGRFLSSGVLHAQLKRIAPEFNMDSYLNFKA